MIFSTFSRCASSSFEAPPHHIAWLRSPDFIKVSRPVMILSSTDIPSKSAMFWKVRAMPIRAT